MTPVEAVAPDADEPAPTRHPAVQGGVVGLAVGALGVVFGDIGTSPLYALQTVFNIDGGAVKATPGDVYGVISLVFWSITLIVSVKYVGFVLRADNDGEGGVMALAALVRRVLGGTGRRKAVVLLLGVLGASLFYGDSLITPAISVLSAVEGTKVAAPELKDAVLPIGVVILVALFAVQRFGTARVGRLFGPVMVLWFVVIALLGLPEIVAHPDILRGLSPTYIVTFIAAHPLTTFVAMGAIVLCITGAEALYADMGHFGRPPIRRAWFCLVFPALTLNYLGQGALILHRPDAVSNPFYVLVPHWAQVPMIVLATGATIIASQAVISGAFSVSHQAVRLGFLPQLRIRQTSAKASGQIYVPVVNLLLFVGVLVLLLTFRSSNRLATAYGIAVTGTLIISTLLLLIIARSAWHWAAWRIVLGGAVVGGLELTFLAANVSKIDHGGWLPLLVAVLVLTVMTTWQRGRDLVTQRRLAEEGPLQEFVDELHEQKIPRVAGTSVFLHPTRDTTPLALRANVEFNHVLHEYVVLISVRSDTVPHVPPDQRVEIDELGWTDDHIAHVSIRYGFQDRQDVPRALRDVHSANEQLGLEEASTTYFLSRMILIRSATPGMAGWRKRLFLGLSHNAPSPAEYFRLPDDRTVEMGTRIEL